jgi:hypothetical protein
MRCADAAAWIGVLPLDRLGGLVVLPDVAHEFALEVGGGREDATVDEVALDLTEPQLDLVEPRRVGRCEVQLDLRVQGEELAHAPGLMGREVVEDDVDLLVARLVGDDRAEKRHELFAGVVGSRVADDCAGPGVECRVKGERALAHVLEAVALGATGRQGQDGVSPVKGLNGGLLVQAEYDSVLRRVQIERDDVGGLGFEVGVRWRPCSARSGVAGDQPEPTPEPRAYAGFRGAGPASDSSNAGCRRAGAGGWH